MILLPRSTFLGLITLFPFPKVLQNTTKLIVVCHSIAAQNTWLCIALWKVSFSQPRVSILFYSIRDMCVSHIFLLHFLDTLQSLRALPTSNRRVACLFADLRPLPQYSLVLAFVWFRIDYYSNSLLFSLPMVSPSPLQSMLNDAARPISSLIFTHLLWFSYL